MQDASPPVPISICSSVGSSTCPLSDAAGGGVDRRCQRGVVHGFVECLHLATVLLAQVGHHGAQRVRLVPGDDTPMEEFQPDEWI